MLKGIGDTQVISAQQIKCQTTVQDLTFDVTYHILPDQNLSENVLLGRDILQQGINVKLSNDTLTFVKSKTSNSCSVTGSFD